MAAILLSGFSVVQAENWVDSFVNGDSNIFVAVGRGDGSSTAADTPYAWDDDTKPPTPVDTVEEQDSFRGNVIGIKRVMISGIMIMVPRIEWAPNRLFNVISNTAVSGKRATDYFCVNSENNVYECISSPGTLTAVGSEPQGFGVQTTADGYQWRFLYNITAAMVNGGMLLDNWMPVPFNKHGIYDETSGNLGTLTNRQYLSGDVNANRALGAYRVLVSCTLKNEGDVIPYNSIYRQVGLLVDPRDGSTGERLEGDLYAPGDTVGTWDRASGELVYLENRAPVYRSEAQRETIEALIVF